MKTPPGKKPKRRSYLLPLGCKDIASVPSSTGKKSSPLKGHAKAVARVNGQIRAREVDLRDEQGSRIGVFPLAEALRQARVRRCDLVQVNAGKQPPICLLIDYGQFRWLMQTRRLASKWWDQ